MVQMIWDSYSRTLFTYGFVEELIVKAGLQPCKSMPLQRNQQLV